MHRIAGPGSSSTTRRSEPRRPGACTGCSAESGIEYVDAPVSGGVSGAVNATLAIMYSGAETTFATLRPVFESMAGNVFRVGSRPGQGQAMKVLNNFLSGTAMAATAEAVAFGVAQGLDMGMILDVVNASSGRNTATADKFPNRVLTGTYDAGFSSTQLNKDLGLYRDAAEAVGASRPVSPAVLDVWRRLEARRPSVDISRLYDFVRDALDAPAERLKSGSGPVRPKGLDSAPAKHG